MLAAKNSVSNRNIKANVSLPASKSISNRLLIIKHLCRDGFHIQNLSDSDDTKTLEACLQNIGHHDVFNAGDAGTPLRFLTALFSITPGTRILKGSERMHERPVGPLVEALKSLGAKITYLEKKGYPPLSITGKNIRGGKISVDAGISSQFISAILLIAPILPEGIIVKLRNNIASVSYIRMTLELMKHSGIESEWSNNIIKIKSQSYVNKNYIVEPDWSAAAFWYVFAALAEEAEIELSGLSKDSLQGDLYAAEIFGKLGVKTTFLPNSVMLTKKCVITDLLDIDFFETPDLLPAVLTAAAALKFPFHFSGLCNLSIKESNRVDAMLTELGKFGYRFRFVNNDELFFEDFTVTPEKEIICDSHNDHRIVMSLAPLALTGKTVIIKNAACISKSYPGYFKELKNAGFSVEFSGN